MQTVSEQDIEILRRLVNIGGHQSDVSSNQRIRLELLGAIKDGPRGIVVTNFGRQLVNKRQMMPSDRRQR
jgi:hypothetical protein